MSEQPMVSVLMTAYNREKYIAEAIESVLTSSYSNLELIIVDDCSKDKTVEIAKAYETKDKRVRVYINEQNLGDYPNRNKAADYASGKYITYVDSDDAIFPDTLQVMVNAACQFQDAALYMAVRSIDEQPESFQYLNPENAYNMHFKENGFMETGPLGVLIAKEIFDKVGGFSGKRMIGDTELWLKMSMSYPIVRLQHNMVFWRQHPEQEYQEGLKYYLVDALQLYRDVLKDDKSPLGKKKGDIYFRKIKLKNYFNLLRYCLRKARFKESFSYFRLMWSIN
jgi:glycosyltransferase involved in cell wall biosynthesis